MNLRNERETLAAVRDWLRNDAVRYGAHQGDEERVFDMGITCSRQYPRCGTVACIGGHAWLIERPTDFDGAADFVNQFESGNARCDDPLAALFYPSGGLLYVEISPYQAADAIDNYLASGKPHWEQILSPSDPAPVSGAQDKA